ncbi:MAG: hypothetical protein HYU28_09740 [Actinobacteria bacterium]|nr:hypothetical protein [Actinomycetota bacterium]
MRRTSTTLILALCLASLAGLGHPQPAGAASGPYRAPEGSVVMVVELATGTMNAPDRWDPTPRWSIDGLGTCTESDGDSFPCQFASEGTYTGDCSRWTASGPLNWVDGTSGFRFVPSGAELLLPAATSVAAPLELRRGDSPAGRGFLVRVSETGGPHVTDSVGCTVDGFKFMSFRGAFTLDV